LFFLILGNLEERIVAGITYFPFLTLFFSIIGIVIEKQSKYCLFHGWQALFVVIIYTVGAIIFGVIDSFLNLGFNVITFIWIVLFFILWVILIIAAILQAESGNPFALPLIGRLAKFQTERRFVGGGNSNPTSP